MPDKDPKQWCTRSRRVAGITDRSSWPEQQHAVNNAIALVKRSNPEAIGIRLVSVLGGAFDGSRGRTWIVRYQRYATPEESHHERQLALYRLERDNAARRGDVRVRNGIVARRPEALISPEPKPEPVQPARRRGFLNWLLGG